MKAQEPVYIHLSEKDGLPDKEFYNILEDATGLIWLCADKGLYSYDGKIFNHYKNELQRGLSVFNVQEDYLGRIWCNNISGQFFYVENNKLHLFTNLSSVLKGELASFKVQQGFLWVFTLKAVYKINIETKRIAFSYLSKKVLGEPSKYNETIYFGNLDSIFQITSKNKIKALLAINLPIKDKKGVRIALERARVFKVDSLFFYRQLRNGENFFLQIDKKTGIVKKSNDFKAIVKERIYNQFENNSEIWFATSSGVWVYDNIGGIMSLKKHFFNNKNVTKIIKDKDDNFWCTTLNNGVYLIPNINIERLITTEENRNITCLDIVNDSTLVFGNADGDLRLYNVKSNKVKRIKLPTKDRVSAIRYHSGENRLYISKDLTGYLYNMSSLQLKKLKGFQTGKSLTIISDAALLYTSNKAVRIVDDYSFKPNNNNNLFKNHRRTYTSHYSIAKKHTYIAFVDNLVRYDSLFKPKVVKHRGKPIYGKSITETINGLIWISTFKDGVFGIKNDTITHHYSTKNGLSSNNIIMVKADQNKLWIASDNSIQLLDVNAKKFETLTKREGIASYNISGIETLNNKVYFASNEGLFSVSKEKPFKAENPDVYFNKVEINEKDTLITTNYTLDYNQNAIKIGFNVNGFLYNYKRRYKYRLKGFSDAWLTTDAGINTVKYNSLPVGQYVFQVKPTSNKKVNDDKVKSISFKINAPFWKTWWFVLLMFSLLAVSIILYYRKQIKKKEKERLVELEKMSLEKELIAINLTALRSQMNPHFIFNTLNSIQDLILKENTEDSYDYVVMFAELIRNTLNYSNQDFISIEKELEFINVYLQLEKLRFIDTFSYSIHFDEKENVDVPSLLIQPFIENALIHGLMHKSGKKELKINFSFNKNLLQCVIIDNGIGRKRAKEISKRQGGNHESFALGAIEKRLKIFKKRYTNSIGFVIEDLYENNNAIGTKVTVTMPYNNRY